VFGLNCDNRDRFATYRTAAKIRYVQRKGFLHHIDIWNIIEAFRENGLNTMEATTLVNRPRLETLLSSLYTSLNKRLPPGQNISVEKVEFLFAINRYLSLTQVLKKEKEKEGK
jgi:hypothetical protein